MRVILCVKTVWGKTTVILRATPWVLWCLAITAPGCSIINLQRNISEMERSIVLAGRVLPDEDLPHKGSPNKDSPDGEFSAAAVTADSDVKPAVFVVVYEQTPQGYEMVDFQQLDGVDYFLFLVAAGHQYYIVAFLDANGNSNYDPGEPLGYYGNPTPISESMEHADKGVTIRLSAEGVFPGQFPPELGADSIIGNKNIPLIFGEIITLDDDRLSRDMARKSLWAPLDFAKQNGVGVFFLEKYSPDKIPVLFINGFGGTPLDWEQFLNNLDRRCYQPWLFYYPTGVRLSKSVKLLSVAVDYFKKQYGVSQLYLVAHSMGGLIARSYVVNTVSHGQPNPVKLLVTFSTPWNGHTAAAQGVKNAPVVMPAWIDIQPDSRFISSLFDIKLRSSLDHYLFFSFNDSRSASGEDNDGAVTLTSQLDYRAQAEAKKLFGVNTSHRGILQDPKVIQTFNGFSGSWMDWKYNRTF